MKLKNKFVNNLKLKYPIMSDHFCLEIYNPKTKVWSIIDPINEIMIESKYTISRYLESSRTLLLFAGGAYTFKPKMSKSENIEEKRITYLTDVTLKYSCYQNQMLSAKSSFLMEDGICKDIEYSAPLMLSL